MNLSKHLLSITLAYLVGWNGSALALDESLTNSPTRFISATKFRNLTEAYVAEALHPCTLQNLQVSKTVVVPQGQFSIHVQPATFPEGARKATVVVLLQGEHTQSRIPTTVDISCPAAVILPGAQVHAIARVGHVRATVPAIAHERGRVGQTIRVSNRLSRASLMARVIDAQTVEVLP